MRYLLWVARLILFLLLLGFAFKNSEPVAVHYYFGQEWRAPMAFVLLVCLCAGAVLGILASLGQVYRQRREILDLRRELRAQARSGRDSPPAVDTDQM